MAKIFYIPSALDFPNVALQQRQKIPIWRQSYKRNIVFTSLEFLNYE